MSDPFLDTKMMPSTEPKYRLAPERAALIRTAPPVVMDLKEASAYLVCSPRKVRDLIASGRIKSARVGAKSFSVGSGWMHSWVRNVLGGPGIFVR